MPSRSLTGFCLGVVMVLLAARAAAAEEAEAPAKEASKPVAAAPQSATQALDRAAAAYEYGDMNLVVESVRPVVEGSLPGTEADRADALRFLGIGLYLTGRVEGSEAAFVQLLRMRPASRLDPTSVRPEVVAFFEGLRRRHADELKRERAARKTYVLNFLPPVGQFQNGDRGRAYGLIAAGVISVGTAIGTLVWLRSEKLDVPGNVFPDPALAEKVKTINHVAVGAAIATYVIGVVDAVIRYDREPDVERSVSLGVAPDGVSLAWRF